MTTMYPAERGSDYDGAEPNEDDQKLLKQLMADFKYGTEHPDWVEIRRQAELDQRALSIKGPWDPKEVEARSVEGQERPCIHLDQLSQYVQALINEAQSNPIAVKCDAVAGVANKGTAQLREDRIRAIEYESKAMLARLTAFESMASHGYGFYGLEIDFKDWDDFQKVIRYRTFLNSHSIIVDPDAQELDWSDMRFSFVLSWMAREKFKEEFPEAKIHDFGKEHMDAGWSDQYGIQIAEYWYKKWRRRRLLQIVAPSFVKPFKVFEDELDTGFKLPDGREVVLEGYKLTNKQLKLQDGTIWTVKDQRTTMQPQIMMVKSNGVELLNEPVSWPGKRIPIFPMVGKQKYERVGNKVCRVFESYIRKARDAQMLFDFYVSSEAEIVSMTSKSPYKVAEGQIDGYEKMWKNIHKVPQGYVKYKPIVEGGALVPPPQRDTSEPPIQALEIGKESARRSIQASVGSYGVTRLDDTNVKSGIAIERLKQQNDMGSYHYMHTLKVMVAEDGRAVNDLLDDVESDTMEVSLRDVEGNMRSQMINVEGKPETMLRLSDEDQFDVTISTGKPYLSQREEAQEIGESVMQNIQTIAMVIGNERAAALIAHLLKMRTMGPDGEKMIEIISPEQKEGDPKKLMRDYQELMVVAEQLRQKVQALEAEKAAGLPKIESNERIAAMEAEIKRMKVMVDAAAKLVELGSAADLNTSVAQSAARIQEVGADNQ